MSKKEKVFGKLKTAEALFSPYLMGHNNMLTKLGKNEASFKSATYFQGGPIRIQDSTPSISFPL